jgi:hypothetical protein
MSSNESVAGAACRLAYDFYLERGSLEEANSYYERAELLEAKMRKFYEQAINLTAKDRFEPHGLSEPELETLVTQLSAVRGLGRTYLVRKVLEDATEPLYVVGAFAAYTWREGENEKHVGALVDELVSTVRCLPNVTFTSLDQNRHLLSKFEEIPGSLLVEGGDENVEFRH